ncbi:NAD(P)-binding protein [Gonapodya prolifera JEL478]|uniref:NAD(P)-binding protein n=1 Tax=Gonapodya prolifera (strain JEL478) TaxID=1344416 RepID=A0A139AN76_GONPJ|nr:NAD(P)-binding protein [Gonapodya prolifera JEL478]|eukprot:KXS18202.1 NAD(P)-binding protein [Gonapodya prolifera JEL478]
MSSERKFVLTGVGGHLGQIAADWCIYTANPGDSLVFTDYSLASLPADKVLEATYDDEESLRRAFKGADVVGFISTWAFGHRAEQTSRVISAAKACGVKRIVYCGAAMSVGPEESLMRDVESLPFLLREHVATERLVMASGMQWNIQRNTLYQDNIIGLFAQCWKFCGDRGFHNSAGQKGAYVARSDCGRVYAALVLGKAPPNTVHLVSGPEAVTDREIFDYVTSKVEYKAEFVEMTDDELASWWREKGLPDDFATGDFSKLPMKICIPDLVCCGECQCVARGYMSEVSDAVEKLTGRRPLGFRENYVQYEHLFPRND